MITNGDTTLDMMPVLMMTTAGVEKDTLMTLTAAAPTVSSRRTVYTVPTATTADEAASAHAPNRFVHVSCA